VLDKMQARLDHMPEAMTIRRQTVEHPFGTLKGLDGQHPLPDPDPRKRQNRDEPAGAGLQYEDMKRMINIFGVNPLMQAIAA
jgi:hypothetical protein